MAHVDEQENIADGLVASASLKAPALSPKKVAPKKKRAKSIGPGGLEKEEEAPLKASSGNRRKVRMQCGERAEPCADCAVCVRSGGQVHLVIQCRRREEAQGSPSQVARCAQLPRVRGCRD
jgi:hypothetical protein